MGLVCCCSLPPSCCPTCPNYTGYFGPTAVAPAITPYPLRVQPIPDYSEEMKKLQEEIRELRKLLEEKTDG